MSDKDVMKVPEELQIKGTLSMIKSENMSRIRRLKNIRKHLLRLEHDIQDHLETELDEKLGTIDSRMKEYYETWWALDEIILPIKSFTLPFRGKNKSIRLP
jgi:hypothetical protein